MIHFLFLGFFFSVTVHSQWLQHYDVKGSISEDVWETSLFYWKGKLYVQENMICTDADHYGNWNASFYKHSYVRIRDFSTGFILVNISETIGYSFISSFPDYVTDTIWLFGYPMDRCGNPIHPMDMHAVQAWYSKDLYQWDTQTVFTYPDSLNIGPNVEVSYVPNPPAGLPPHRYIMMIECFNFVYNNNPDGDLTHGWGFIPSYVAPPGAPCGGPSMRFNPEDQYYYIITGGNVVDLYRTQNFLTWESSPYNPLIQPTPQDAQVSPYAGFQETAVRKGYIPTMRDNWQSWDWNSNDADVCCQHPDVKESYLVWGASTQGSPPKPPVVGHICTNALGVANVTLNVLLRSYFK